MPGGARTHIVATPAHPSNKPVAGKPDQVVPAWDWGFLGPRYWGTWLLVGLLRLGACLPYRPRVAAGVALGVMLRLMMPGRRRVARVNLELCFPELDKRARERLLSRHFRALGAGFIDMGVAWWGDGARIARVSRVHGMQHLEHALAEGHGVILVSGHFTTMEMGVRLLTLFAPSPWLYSIYRRSKNRLFERVMLRGRSGQPAVMFPREEVRTMINALRAGMPVCFFPDQDHGSHHSVFVPFCGVPAATVRSTARLARRTGARVVPYFQHRLPGTRGYELEVLPALENFPSGDDERDAARVSALIEAAVRHHPHEYLWIHRRFKTRPAGAADVYRVGAQAQAAS